MNNRRGFMEPERTAWCGLCPDWERFSGNFIQCAKQARQAGWKHTKADGWVCPKCAPSTKPKEKKP